MHENHMHVSVRSSQNACVSRRMRETWKVCKMCRGDLRNFTEDTQKTSKLHEGYLPHTEQTFHSGFALNLQPSP